MDSKKYEKLIDLIINENEDKAKELFHEIVVEQSREIYESIMAEEMMGMDEEEGMGGEVGDLLDEISAEEAGVSEDEEHEGEEELDGAEEVFDLEAGDEEAEPAEEVEDAVIRIEDKLDQLMAEFEQILGGDQEPADDAELDMDADLGDEEVGDVELDAEGGEELDDEMMQEAVQLQKVSPHHGDDGDQKRSPVAADSGKAGMDSKPVHFSGGDEKGRPAPQTKDVKGAGSFKNAPGGKKVDLSSAPKPVTKADSDNDKSPVAK